MRKKIEYFKYEICRKPEKNCRICTPATNWDILFRWWALADNWTLPHFLFRLKLIESTLWVVARCFDDLAAVHQLPSTCLNTSLTAGAYAHARACAHACAQVCGWPWDHAWVNASAHASEQALRTLMQLLSGGRTEAGHLEKLAYMNLRVRAAGERNHTDCADGGGRKEERGWGLQNDPWSK